MDRLQQERGVNLVAVSPWYETTPVGSVETRFINGVVEVATSLQPIELLDVLQQIELELGRQPGDRWGPRAIDLDLLAQGESQYHDGRLDVPHPAAWYRRFVLDPWEQIAGDWVVPRWAMTVADLRRRLLQRPLPVGLIGGSRDDLQEIADCVTDDFRGLTTISQLPQSDDGAGGNESHALPLRMSVGYLSESMTDDMSDARSIDLSQLATSLGVTKQKAAHFVLTAALDDPRQLNR